MFSQLIVLFVICIQTANLTNERLLCPPKPFTPQPPNRVNTTLRLAKLRNLILKQQVDAVYITIDDEHQTEDISDYHQRLQYISGFSGSSAYVIVTNKEAVLWTDGRYDIQADEELDCNWELIKMDRFSVLTILYWLNKYFPNGSRIILADPKLISAEKWFDFESNLKLVNTNFELVKSTKNVVDQIWINHNNTLNETHSKGYVLSDAFTGMNALVKVEMVRRELELLTANAIIVTALDEVAWVLNIRGEDIPNSKLLFAYVIISLEDVVLYIDKYKTENNITSYFSKLDPNFLTILPYENIWTNFANISHNWKKILVPSSNSFSDGASKEIYDLVPKEKLIFKPSPIIAMKAVKNPVEILGMEAAHTRDSVALCQFIQYLDEHYESERKSWDELRVADVLENFRSKQKYFAGLSFPTIAGFGPHGALPHYIATKFTSSQLYDNSTLVIDSGGQYYDGTTDVTRTLHLGIPTEEHKEAYTRVLIGCIQLSDLTFSDQLPSEYMDVLARSALWKIGYDYGHGTGHGIGAFLNVHEAPINVHYKNANSTLFKPGHFLSIEPGIYLKNNFGVRLENIVKVVLRSNLKYNERSNVYLGFEDVTLVPYNPKLIKVELLNQDHFRWLKKYNKKIRKIVGLEMLKQNLTKAYTWLLKNTRAIDMSFNLKSTGNKFLLQNYFEVLIVFLINFYL